MFNVKVSEHFFRSSQVVNTPHLPFVLAGEGHAEFKGGELYNA